MKLVMVVPLAISAIRQRMRTRKVAAQNFDRRLLDDEEFFKKLNNCDDGRCIYQEPHRHGFACTSDCRCNRHGRVD